jgi:hypothetical protein
MPDKHPPMDGPYARAAHAYHAAGWPGVLPLPFAQKKNPPDGWTGHHDNWTSSADIQAWTEGDHSNGNICLRLPSTVIGIDVDAYGDKPGGETLREKEANLGPLPPTWRTTSRNDGISGIRLYRVQPGQQWITKMPGIEIIQRGHRYALVWPSQHDTTPNTYRWIDPHGATTIGAIPTPADLPELPQAWVKYLRRGEASDQPRANLTAPDAAKWLSTIGDGDPCLVMAETVTTASAALKAGADSRHDTMIEAQNRIITLATQGHHGAIRGLGDIRTAWAQHVESDPTRTKDPAEWTRGLAGAVNLAAAEQPTEHPADPCIVTILEEPELEDIHAAVRERFPVLNWRELWDDETEEEWLIEPLIAKRRLIALYSAPKVGKSLLMLELAVAMACGKAVLGSPAAEPQTVLYVDFENDPRGDVRERLRDMDVQPESLERLMYLSFPTIAKFDTERGGNELLAVAQAYGATVIVIDTVSRAVQGDENENDTWLSFYRNTGMKLKQAEIACVRLDHSGKDEMKGQRGGSAKSGDVDAVWRLSRVNDVTFSLVCEASRMQLIESELTFTRHSNPLRHRIHGDAVGARLEADKELIFSVWAASETPPADMTIRLANDQLRASSRRKGLKTDRCSKLLEQWKASGAVRFYV